jgi:glycosyltransferase involved in cell wall biosynthesis
MIRTIAYFTDTIGFGGAEQALLTLIAGLNRAEWRPVLIYHPSAGVTPLIEGAADLDVELWPVPSMPAGRVGASRVLRFVREVRARRPDVFHAHLTWPLACKFGLVGAILAHVPAIVATVQLFLDFPVDLSILAQQRLIAARVDRYVAVSHDTAQQLIRKLHWPSNKVQVIHNSVTYDPISHQSNRARHAQQGGHNRPVALTVARLDEQKGHRYLLEAAAQMPDVQFVLAGDGPLRSSLETQVEALGLADRVNFLGYRTDIRDLLASCDVFVLPSLYEGLPLSILEAMAAGKPVIATQVGGTAEVVLAGETGLLVPPSDSIALAKAIRSVVDDRALAQRLGSAGQVRVEHEFSTAVMLRQVISLYTELLARYD